MTYGTGPGSGGYPGDDFPGDAEEDDRWIAWTNERRARRRRLMAATCMGLILLPLAIEAWRLLFG